VEQRSNRDVACSVIVITAAFIVSRLLCYAAGVRFDMTPLDTFFQFIDPKLLRTHLLESLFYLHSQPPLFNLFLGSVLKVFPGNERLAFSLLWLLLGYLLAITLFLLMRRLGVSKRINLVLTTLFIIGPQCIVFENWLFYTYPVALMLSLAALLLHRYISGRRLLDGCIFFTLLAIIALTRSFFHIAWFVVIVALLLWYSKGYRRGIVLAALVPFLLVLSLYVKNAMIFGSFTSSTWLGMNVSRMTTFRLGEDLRREMVRRGELSRLALIERFRPLREYRGIVDDSTRSGIEVLDQETKSSGAPNFNNKAYIAISQGYLRDALHVVMDDPRIYLDAYLRSYFTYFVPSSNYLFVEDNRSRIETFDRIYSLVVLGQPLPYNTVRNEKGSTRYLVTTLLTLSIVLLVALPFLTIYGWSFSRRLFMSVPDASPVALTVLFLIVNIVYVTVVGNAFEMAENNRFRFTIDAYLFALAGLFLTCRWNDKPRNNRL
jgi:hypothetical protein